MLSPQLEQELRDEFTRVARRIEPPEGLSDRVLGHVGGPRRSRRRLPVVVGPLALLLVVGAVVVLARPTSSPNSSQSAIFHGNLTLRLVDDQVSLVSNSSLGAEGSVSAISCSTANDCIAVGDATQQGVGFAATTTDGGPSWSEDAVPSDLRSLTALSCSNANQCVATGSRMGAAALLATTDGGTTWQYLDVPVGVTSLASVSCAADQCWAVGTAVNGAVLLRGSPTAAWTLASTPEGVTALSAVGCTGSAGAPTCMAVGSASSTPAVIASISGAPWASLAPPPGARALASAACTGSSAASCTTLVQENNYWVEASRYVSSTGPAGEWNVPQLLASGGTVATGTVLEAVSTCIAIGGPSCTPSNAELVDTVTDVIAGLNGGGSTAPGPADEPLTSAYFSSEPSFSEPSASLPLSPVWYMGVSGNGLSADEVLTGTERMS